MSRIKPGMSHHFEVQVSLEVHRGSIKADFSNEDLKISLSSVFCCFLSLQYKINLRITKMKVP